MSEYSDQYAREEQLIISLKLGKQEALGLLYDKYAPVLFGVISRLVAEEAQAEKILIMTFMRSWSEIDSYNPCTTRLLTWLIGIARVSVREMAQPAAAALQGRENGLHADTDVQITAQKDTFAPEENGLTALDLIFLKGYRLCAGCRGAARARGLTQLCLAGGYQKA